MVPLQSVRLNLVFNESWHKKSSAIALTKDFLIY